MESRIVFFIGKGGAGKSTVSALTGLYSASCNKKTLLVSLDPAHNQGDIFNHKFSEKPNEIHPKLFVIEIDIDKRIKSYLKKTSEKIQVNYNYQSAFNLKNYFKLLKHSPGIEENAMLQAFEEITFSHKDKELIVFDMPPTALSLRFFSLPFISKIWLDQLSSLREAIHKKKEIISRVKFGSKEIETDKVKNQLTKIKDQQSQIQQIIGSDKTSINIVCNNDLLSINELIRIKNKLQELNIKPQNFVVNKTHTNHQKIEINGSDEVEIVAIKNSERYLIGKDILYKFMTNESISNELSKLL